MCAPHHRAPADIPASRHGPCRRRCLPCKYTLGSVVNALWHCAQDALFAYLNSVGALPAHAQVPGLKLLQFGHGQSNPTYLVQVRQLYVMMNFMHFIVQSVLLVVAMHQVMMQLQRAFCAYASFVHCS